MIDYAVVVKQAPPEKIRVDDSLRKALKVYSNDRRISKQDIMEGLLTWFFQQDPLAQGMILGQTPASEDLLEALITRIVSPARYERDFANLAGPGLAQAREKPALPPPSSKHGRGQSPADRGRSK